MQKNVKELNFFCSELNETLEQNDIKVNISSLSWKRGVSLC